MENKYTPKTPEHPIYILTNNIGVEGAVSVLYTDILENLKTKLQDNLYVIPSSINEVLIVHQNFADGDSLKNMMKNINYNMVAENERR